MLRGGTDLLAEEQIRLVFTEVVFWEMYEGGPTFDALYRFLTDPGFRLVGL